MSLTSADITRLSQAYADPTIAAKQRELVGTQLAAMYAGNAPRHFSVVGVLLQGLREQSDLETVTLLDAGCASCYYHEVIDYYTPGWVQYAGVDYNLGMIEMVHWLYPELPIYKADLCDLSIFADQSYGIVLEGAALVQIQEWKLALSELARVARRWLILHRESFYWGNEPTSCEITRAYDNEVWSVRLNFLEVTAFLARKGFSMVSTTCITDSRLQSGRTVLFERAQ